MRRPLLTVALLYLGGVWLGDYVRAPLVLLFGASFGAGISAFVWKTARPLLLVPFLIFTGWTNLAWRTAVLAPDDLRTLLGGVELVTVRGRLIETPTQRIYEQNDQVVQHTLAKIGATSLRRNSEWEHAFGSVAVSTQGVLGTNFFAGQIVEVVGVIRSPKGPAAEGLFDYRTYLRRLGIYHQLQVESTNDWQIVSTDLSPRTRPMADRFRDWAKATLQRGLPAEDEPLQLTWAMALGWQTALTGEVSEPFMRSGTMHIFAISGLHIALIAGILVNLLRVLRVPRGACGLVVIPLIWFYTAATGWQSSAIRSTVMMTVIIGGWALKRPSDLLNSLGGAAFIILLWDPQQLFQASFQLSFFVVASIALLLPPIEKLRQRLLQPDPLRPPELRPRWQRWLDWPVHFLTINLATSFAAWLGSLPLIAYYFHLFTPVSLLANLVIVPLSSLALACNLGSLVCGGWLPVLTELFNHSGWFWMKCMIAMSDWFARLPGAYCYVPAPAVAIFVVYYALLLAALKGWLFRPEWRRWSLAGAGALVLAGALVWLPHRNDVRLTVLALRAGDALFLDAPGRANDLLIDCGDASSAGMVVKPFLRAQGVNRLAQLLLTHGDPRHIGGATNIAASFAVRKVLTSPVQFRSPMYRQTIDALKLSPDTVRQLNRGDHFGMWTVLHPDAQDRFPLADDNAVVLRGEFYGVRVLLCSDLGKLGQRALLEREPDLRADIVVAGVPAREEPLSDALLDAIQPKAIIISAGEYPASERVTDQLRERLGRRGIPIFYTIDDGAVTLTLRPKSWEVRAMSGKQFSAIAK